MELDPVEPGVERVGRGGDERVEDALELRLAHRAGGGRLATRTDGRRGGRGVVGRRSECFAAEVDELEDADRAARANRLGAPPQRGLHVGPPRRRQVAPAVEPIE